MLLICILAILLGIFYYRGKTKDNSKYAISNNCELVQAFSYSGDIVGCREYNGSVPQNARDWCYERLRISPEYNKYEGNNCELVGMTSTGAGENMPGCTEYCDFICCK
jgi:hypothetical protein